MADTKISALPASTTPLAGTEVLPIVQSGVTKQVSVASLTAGRNPAMNYALTNNGVIIQNSGVTRWFIEREAGASDDLFVYRYNDAGGYAGNPLQISRSNGNVRLEANLVIGTSGRGIDFSATPGTGTSELLDDYEEGDFTPTIEGTTAAGVGTYSVRAGRYTKIGRLVTYTIQIAWSAHTGTGNMILTGLPFASTGINAAQFIVPISLTVTAGSKPSAIIPGGVTTMTLYNQVAGSISLLPLDTAATLNIAGHYIVS
jgi:hypothetical protein